MRRHKYVDVMQDIYARQLHALATSASGRHKTVIFFVVAGQIPSFRALEGWSARPIDVMPVHAGDIFEAQ